MQRVTFQDRNGRPGDVGQAAGTPEFHGQSCQTHSIRASRRCESGSHQPTIARIVAGDPTRGDGGCRAIRRTQPDGPDTSAQPRIVRRLKGVIPMVVCLKEIPGFQLRSNGHCPGTAPVWREAAVQRRVLADAPGPRTASVPGTRSAWLPRERPLPRAAGSLPTPSRQPGTRAVR